MLGVIGGSGLYSLGPASGFQLEERWFVMTRWGRPSSSVSIGRAGSGRIAFIARHGGGHAIAPDRINYRGNIEALRMAGVDRILAVGSVGGIAPECVPGTLVVPDQLIDYTHGREGTLQGSADALIHVDFTHPFSPEWRRRIIDLLAGLRDSSPLVDGGVYGVTQGPRFETAAEIARLARDGCTVVGMTAMPEAVLAREAGVEYAMVCPVGNLAAGIASGELDHEEVLAATGATMPVIESLIIRLA